MRISSTCCASCNFRSLAAICSPPTCRNWPKKMAREYPTRNAQMNRELVRLVVFLQGKSAHSAHVGAVGLRSSLGRQIAGRVVCAFPGRLDHSAKTRAAQIYEKTRMLPGGHSYEGYIDNVSRDFFAKLNDDERSMILTGGAKWPNSALAVLRSCPLMFRPQPSSKLSRSIGKLLSSKATQPISLASALSPCWADLTIQPPWIIYAKCSKISRSSRAHCHVADAKSQPRQLAAAVQSLPVVEGAFAQQVLIALTKVDQTPDKSGPYRQVILRGLNWAKTAA